MREPLFEATETGGWDEDDWERFLQLADARAAKFEELFETFFDDPRREEIISHEMGWDDIFQQCRSRVDNCEECSDRFSCEVYEMLRLLEGPDNIDDDPEARELIACFDQVKEIPAYERAYGFSARLERFLRAHFADDFEDEALRSALLCAAMVPAQIAGGHGIGYERDSLCGNIANCKRALRSLDACIEGLRDLERRGLIGPRDGLSLQSDAARVRREVERWIEDLRSRVWWR